jgi:hypothetical protein
MAGVPELGGRAENVGFSVHEDVLNQRIGFKLGAARIAWLEREQKDGAPFALLEGLDLCTAALDALLLEDGGLVFFQRVESVEEARGGKAERGSGLAGGPDIDQAVQCVFALLDAW